MKYTLFEGSAGVKGRYLFPEKLLGSPVQPWYLAGLSGKLYLLYSKKLRYPSPQEKPERQFPKRV
jgi:hypothetical protein